jgi:hypothetical protein
MKPTTLLLFLFLWIHATHSSPCPTNEILLRNRTCFCPFFKFNNQCLRQRFQTTVNATLDELDEPALVRILVEPKNALIKQYQKLFAIRSLSSSRDYRFDHSLPQDNLNDNQSHLLLM